MAQPTAAPVEAVEDHSDWGYLPPPALELVGKALPPGPLLRARLVCKHWAATLAMVIDQLNIVPEFFLNDATAAHINVAFPRAKTVTMDLQDTFMCPPPENETAAPCATPDDAPGPQLENIPVDPRVNFIAPSCTHLRIRLPDTNDATVNSADVPNSWVYVNKLLDLHSAQLQGLHLSVAPGPSHITMLAQLSQLTSLTMEEAVHTQWSNDHISIVGSLTTLKCLTIKIPPYRVRPEQATNPQNAPSLLNAWMSLTNLTKLHVCVMRYSYHASLVAILPCLTNLESLAIRAPQTRLPWPGTDKPLFDNIGTLTGLTSLCLALVDHTMQAANWSALQPLTALTALELSVSEGSDGLNIPTGMMFKSLKTLKLRYPNSHDLVRIAHWGTLQRLDIKFPEHEREWHQEDACQELIEVVAKLPHTTGGQLIASVLSPQASASGVAGSSTWWSPLLPLLALPNLTDFRCSAKEGLASHDPILFDEILNGMSAAWPGVTRLAFKGSIQVQSQSRGWDSFKAMTRLQQLELRHHPPLDAEDSAQLAGADARAKQNKFLRVEPIRLPAVSLPDALQTLLLENVELRRKEVECLRNLTSLERRTTCRHFPEFVGMPLQRLVVSNCCVKAKGITSIASECKSLTHLVFAVYKVTEVSDLQELQRALREMVCSLRSLQVLKIRVQAACITQELIDDMVTNLTNLQRLKLTSSDGWQDISLFSQLTRIGTLRKCSLAYFKQPSLAKEVRAVFRQKLPYCKIKAKHEEI